MSFLKNSQFQIFNIILFLIIPSFELARGAESSSALKLKLTETEVREQMIKISAELGVACTECHNVNNFRDESLVNFRVAREHMKLVEVLKSAGMNGQKNQPEASCFTCHRGQLKYEHKMKAENPHYKKAIAPTNDTHE